MQIYQLIKHVSQIQSPRLISIGVWGAMVLHKRFAGVFVDPILSCNYRCQMCYFSDDEYRKTMHGRLSKEQIHQIASSLFAHALKLQIGCGAEPTMDINGTQQIIQLGREYQVPYISLTSNGALLTEPILREWIQTGLNELTLSLHGIHKDTYEQLMGSTSQYERFIQLLETIRIVKQDYPTFMVRINYTMNADNVEELKDWDTVFGNIPVDIIQLRPIRQMGNTTYHNFDLSKVEECMPSVIEPLVKQCQDKGITVIVTDINHINRFEKKQSTNLRKDLLSNYLYYNISPRNYTNTPLDIKRIQRDVLKIAFYPLSRLSQDSCLINSLNYSIL